MKSKVICVIMGGGRGTRLHPLTKDRCKPAVPLAGKYRLVDIPISNCLNSGFNQIYLLTQFNTASLHKHITQTYKFDPFANGFVDILAAEQTISGEAWYQGTADAVRQNMHHFSVRDDDLFLILSGDQLYRMDFRKIIDQHRKTEADITIAAKAIAKAQVHGLGVMRVNDDCSIEEFVEKPTDPKIIDKLVIGKKLRSQLKDPGNLDYCLASMGIYVFNAKVMREALKTDATDFGKEIIPGMLGQRPMYAHIFDDYWEDIGTVRAFFDTNLLLTDPVPPFNFYDAENLIYTHARYLPASKLNSCRTERAVISDGCIITDATLKRCVIGVRSVIREGTILENVVMMGADNFEAPEDLERNRNYQRPDIGIGRNCHIKNAIIDKNARIGNNVVLSPKGKPDLYEKDDIFVRDGVLLVNKNAVVPDNFVLE
jgi:glucose-1-phosphate adenylyltransferase